MCRSLSCPPGCFSPGRLWLNFLSHFLSFADSRINLRSRRPMGQTIFCTNHLILDKLRGGRCFAVHSKLISFLLFLVCTSNDQRAPRVSLIKFRYINPCYSPSFCFQKVCCQLVSYFFLLSVSYSREGDRFSLIIFIVRSDELEIKRNLLLH